MRDTERASVRRPVRRRELLGGLAGGITLAAAGCLGVGGDDAADVTPVALDGERPCDQCGMIIEDYPGPVGQIHFADDEPEDGRPAGFCSSTCTYTYLFDAEDADRDPRAVLLTDYSVVDQEAFEEGSDVMFSSHVESGAFSSIDALTVVIGSDVVGAMGPELIPFGDDGDVEAFVGEYGGDPMNADAVDRATVDAL